MTQVKNGPSITSLTPNPVSSGFTGPLTVTGTGYTSSSQVSVGGTMYTPNSQTSSQLVVNPINAVTASTAVQVHNGAQASNTVMLNVK
jgi:hypothetical protein